MTIQLDPFGINAKVAGADAVLEEMLRDAEQYRREHPQSDTEICENCQHERRFHLTVDRQPRGCDYERGTWITGGDGTQGFLAHAPCGCACFCEPIPF